MCFVRKFIEYLIKRMIVLSCINFLFVFFEDFYGFGESLKIGSCLLKNRLMVINIVELV